MTQTPKSTYYFREVALLLIFSSFTLLLQESSHASSKCVDNEWQLSLISVDLIDEGYEGNEAARGAWSDVAYLAGLFNGVQSFEFYTLPDIEHDHRASIRLVIENISNE